jgi:nucleotide-binding universal stress UspA family protein
VALDGSRAATSEVDMALFRHIVALVDLSSHSVHTAGHAAGLARSAGATLTLLHVIPRPGTPAEGKARRNAALAHLATMADDLRASWVARVAVVEGDARDEVRAYAMDHGADLLVVGARHRNLLERLFLLSTGERITTAGDWSVLAVPDPTEDSARPAPRHGEILCAIDLSETSPAALQAAAALARARRAHLTMLHTIDLWRWYDPAPVARGAEAEIRRETARAARERLSRMIAAETGPALNVDSLIAFGPAGDQIRRMAGWLQADLLVIGAHSNRVIGDSSLGPTAGRVLRQAPCPLLIVRARPIPVGIEAHALATELVGTH